MTRDGARNILGIREGDSPEVIKAAFRQLAKKYHPDANLGEGSAEAEEMFKHVQLAYRILTGKEKPSEEETTIFSKSNNATSREDKNILDPMFVTNGNVAHLVKKNASCVITSDNTKCSRCELTSDFKKTRCLECHGVGFKVKSYGILSTKEPCAKCAGTGLVEVRPKCRACPSVAGDDFRDKNIELLIPQGTRPGDDLIFPIHLGPNDSQQTNIILKIEVNETNGIKTAGDDIQIDAYLDLATFITGKVILVNAPDGNQLSLKIVPGTQPGTIVSFPERGLPSQEGKRGKLSIRLNCRIPKIPNAEQIKWAQEWTKLKG